MAYDIRSFAKLGLVDKLISGVDADAPRQVDVRRVHAELLRAVADTRAGARGLASRLASPEARESRAASIDVRRRLASSGMLPDAAPAVHALLRVTDPTR